MLSVGSGKPYVIMMPTEISKLVVYVIVEFVRVIHKV